MQTLPISTVAAAEALGGPPMMPPAVKPQPIGTARADAGVVTAGAEARAAASQRIATGGSPERAAFGNATFDGPPAELSERRGKAETARRRLANLATLIVAEQAALGSLLDDLADDAAALKAAEHFDVATAKKFLKDLAAVVEGLKSKPAPKPAK
jgi:hypothetical protein